MKSPLLVFMGTLGIIAITAMIIGAVLASQEYSSAGAFSIAAACVGVLGTLTVEQAAHDRENGKEQGSAQS